MDAGSPDAHGRPTVFPPGTQPAPVPQLRPPVPNGTVGDVRTGWHGIAPTQAGVLGVAAMAVVGAAAVGWRWAGRPARIGPITMGPGGWVSVKGARQPADPGVRPWWAKLLRAYRL